jgi:hypothetical protein
LRDGNRDLDADSVSLTLETVDATRVTILQQDGPLDGSSSGRQVVN